MRTGDSHLLNAGGTQRKNQAFQKIPSVRSGHFFGGPVSVTFQVTDLIMRPSTDEEEFKVKSFTSVAVETVEEVFPGVENVESIVKRLIRQFTKFIEMTGGSVDELKDKKGRMMFAEDDVPILKLILTQFAQQSGFAYDFLKKKVDLASLEDTHVLIQELLDAMAADGLTESEAQVIVDWLDRVFRFSFRVEICNCHRIVDGIAVNMLQYPYTYSMRYVNQLHRLLQREFVRIITGTVMEIGELAEFLQMAKEVAEVETPSELYGEEDDEIKSEYCQRDADVIAFLKDNPEIRRYVENRVGATVEEIWGINEASCSDKKTEL